MEPAALRVVSVVLLVLSLRALEAYEWAGGPDDNGHISACQGASVAFPWSLAMTPGVEAILNVSWLFQKTGAASIEVASHKTHFRTKHKHRFAFLPNAGLLIKEATPQDSGTYSVNVTLRQEDLSLTSVSRTVTLSVIAKSPAVNEGAVQLRMGNPVKNNVTGDWNVQLLCGRFVDLGLPPRDVRWTTPSGEVRNSSYEDNGTFVLSVSSPVQGGNYSCHLPPSAPAARCLTATSPLKAAAQLYVDDKDVRLSLLEARQRELVSLHADLRDSILQQVTADMANLTWQMSALNDKMDRFLHNPKQLIKHRGNASSCVDWLAVDPRSGVRTVYVSGEAITVFCDQQTDNGGWIVFQRRKDATVDFYRGWTDYRNGFGDLGGNFWLGLDKLHRLTTSQRYELRVDMQKVDLTKGYATYSGFYVEGRTHNFALHFDSFTGGNVDDRLSYHRGQQFSTKDRDNDAYNKNCAQDRHSAWWFNNCDHSDLNRRHPASGGGLYWSGFGSDIKFSEMKIRPM